MPKRKMRVNPKARRRHALVQWFTDPAREVPWRRLAHDAGPLGIAWLAAGPQGEPQAVVLSRCQGRWHVRGLLGNQFKIPGQPGEARAWMRWFLPPGVHPKQVAQDLRRAHRWFAPVGGKSKGVPR
jgi:hypothetical protein